MAIRQATAIYFSPTHTTERACMAFASGTGLPFEKIDLTTPRARSTFSRHFGDNELAIVGLPVYGGRLPKHIEDFFSGLTGHSTIAVAIVLYGNREYEDALLELKLRLEERGFIVRAAATFIGEHSISRRVATGRPDANDLALADAFGREAMKSITGESLGELVVKGSYPFVAKGSDPHYQPTTTSDCTKCGLCAQNCPYGAIDPNDCQTVDASKCMRCCRCIKDCPSSAKQFTDEAFLARLPDFERRLNAKRCEPELFLPQ